MIGSKCESMGLSCVIGIIDQDGSELSLVCVVPYFGGNRCGKSVKVQPEICPFVLRRR